MDRIQPNLLSLLPGGAKAAASRMADVDSPDFHNELQREISRGRMDMEARGDRDPGPRAATARPLGAHRPGTRGTENDTRESRDTTGESTKNEPSDRNRAASDDSAPKANGQGRDIPADASKPEEGADATQPAEGDQPPEEESLQETVDQMLDGVQPGQPPNPSQSSLASEPQVAVAVPAHSIDQSAEDSASAPEQDQPPVLPQAQQQKAGPESATETVAVAQVAMSSLNQSEAARDGTQREGGTGEETDGIPPEGAIEIPKELATKSSSTAAPPGHEPASAELHDESETPVPEPDAGLPEQPASEPEERTPRHSADVPAVETRSNDTRQSPAVVGGPAASLSGVGAGQSNAEAKQSPQVDPARFVSRVSRAIEVANERGGPVQLRLSPPELGAMRVELSVQQGVLTARLETETAAAKNIVLDNLPALRERLAGLDIRVERFDVDVRQESTGGQPDWQAQQEARDQQSARPRQGAMHRVGSRPDEPSNAPRAPVSPLHAGDSFNAVA